MKLDPRSLRISGSTPPLTNTGLWRTLEVSEYSDPEPKFLINLWRIKDVSINNVTIKDKGPLYWIISIIPLFLERNFKILDAMTNMKLDTFWFRIFIPYSDKSMIYYLEY